MHPLKLIAVFCIALFVGKCDSKVVVDPVSREQPSEADGVLYALPNTVARAQVKIDKSTKKGGPYWIYAGIFAPDGDPICTYKEYNPENYKRCLEGEDSYSLQQGATFATYGEPDPENVFVVKFTGKGPIDQTLSMTWNEAGLLSAASASVTNRTGDVIVSGLKLITGLGIKAALGAAAVDNKNLPTCDIPLPQDTWIIRTLANNGGEQAAALISNYCTLSEEERRKFPEKEDVVATHKIKLQDGTEISGKTYETLLVEALKKYTDDVAKLMVARLKILGGTSSSFEPASLLPHIEGEINRKLTALFLGKKETTTWEGALDIRDLRKDQLVVLRINEQKGICLKESEPAPDAKPFPKKFGILTGADCDKGHPIYLSLAFFPEPSHQLFTRIRDQSTGQRSFRYRIPAQMKAALIDRPSNDAGVEDPKEVKTVYGSAVFAVAQRGTIVSLPANRHSKTLSYELALIEATGGMKTFKLGTSGGLEASTIDALAGIGGDVIDARNKKRESESELNQLTRQQQLLKLQDDICTIQKKYGLPCTTQPQ